MRRLRNDLPYTFRPPKLQHWLRPLGLALNRAVHLERKYRIGKIETEGFAACPRTQRGRARACCSRRIIPTTRIRTWSWSSPPATACGPLFMAAREIFEVSPTAAWALQSMGVFSVDRDGPDLSAIKTAITLLESGTDPLVIFPEGEIYHHHRRLDPLNEGVASILLKVAGRHACRKKRVPRAGGPAVFP